MAINIPEIDDIMRMRLPELRKWTGSARDAANKRIARLESAGLQKKSLAYEGLRDRYGVQRTEHGSLRFRSTGASDINRARAEALSVRQFLGYKTSTIGGTRSYRENVRQVIGDEIFSDEDLEDNFWKAVDRFRDNNKDLPPSDKLITYARTAVERDGNVRTDDIYQRLTEIAKEENAKRTQYDPFAMGEGSGGGFRL